LLVINETAHNSSHRSYQYQNPNATNGTPGITTKGTQPGFLSLEINHEPSPS
jgi:hypothetical protein